MRIQIFIAALLAASLPAFSQSNRASISGRVTDTDGKPIAKVTVLLTAGAPGTGTIPPQPYRATTAADGTWTITGLEPTRYGLQAVRAGYVTASIQNSPNRLNLAAGEQRKDVNLQMTPAGLISGTVVDEKGDPVAGASVRVWRRNHVADGKVQLTGISGPGVGTPMTDLNGHYRIQNLEPETYYVSAGTVNPSSQAFDILGQVVSMTGYALRPALPGQTSEGYLPTWYPHATQAETAVPVVVSSGEEVQKIDIQLQKTRLYVVGGKVIASGSASLNPATMRLSLLQPDGQPMNGQITQSNIGTDGSFQLNGLTPGDYLLGVQGTTQSGGGFLARRKITVAGKDLPGVELVLPSMGSINGSITINGKPVKSGADPGLYTVQLISVDAPRSPGPGSVVGTDGSFTIPNVLPGDYRLQVTTPPGTRYVHTATLGGVELGTGPLTLASGPATLQISFVSATGSIRVNLWPASNGVMANSVFITPAEPIPGLDWRSKSLAYGDAGSYVIYDLPPGTYRLYGWTPVSQGVIFDPDSLKPFESQSVKATLTGGETVAVTVPSISPAR